jgi:ankyrin repeat protein
MFIYCFITSATLMPSSFEKAIMDNDHKHVKRELDQRQPVPANSANAGLQTGLMIACQHSSVQTVKVFLEKSTQVKHDDPSLCNVNLVDASGWTALHYAAKSGSLECVKLLIEHKSDINAITNENETALFTATKHNQLNVVKLLATSNCQLQTKAGSGKITALELAVTENLVEIATCLLFHLTRTKELHKEELNQLLVKAAEKGHTNIANELLINGANVNNHEGT